MVSVRKISWRKWALVLAHYTLRTGAVLLTLVALILVLGYSSGGFRVRLVTWGLDLAAEAIPGDLQVGEMEWPELGHIILTDVLWTDNRALMPER